MEKRIINTYKELVWYIKHSRESFKNSIGNFDYPFELDFRRLLLDTGYYEETIKECTLYHMRSLTLCNIKCKTLYLSHLHFDDDTDFLIKDSDIEKLEIFSCHFFSLNIFNIVTNKLIIKDSKIKGESDFYFDSKQTIDGVKMDIEDVSFKRNLKVSNLLLYKGSKLTILGESSVISGDLVFSNMFLLGGAIDIRGIIKHNLCFYFINYQGEEDYYKNPINYGELELHDVTVGNELVFLYCHLGELGITNCNIKGIRETFLSYNKLQYGAAVVLRNAALSKNDVILSEKYTAEIYDALIHYNSAKTFKRWASHLNSKSLKKRYGVRDCIYKYIFEPIVLLIPSFSYNEGLLLWLNKYSNDYNRSWKRGILFTLIITLFSYIILNYFGIEEPFFVFDPQFNGFGEVMKGYLSLLDIFNLTGITDKISYNLTPCGYIILFVGKVLITYGLWQTIYAFYKYRK